VYSRTIFWLQFIASGWLILCWNCLLFLCCLFYISSWVVSKKIIHSPNSLRKFSSVQFTPSWTWPRHILQELITSFFPSDDRGRANKLLEGLAIGSIDGEEPNLRDQLIILSEPMAHVSTRRNTGLWIHSTTKLEELIQIQYSSIQQIMLGYKCLTPSNLFAWTRASFDTQETITQIILWYFYFRNMTYLISIVGC